MCVGGGANFLRHPKYVGAASCMRQVKKKNLQEHIVATKNLLDECRFFAALALGDWCEWVIIQFYSSLFSPKWVLEIHSRAFFFIFHEVPKWRYKML